MQTISDKQIIQILVKLHNYRQSETCFSCNVPIAYAGRITKKELENFKETVLCPTCYNEIQSIEEPNE